MSGDMVGAVSKLAEKVDALKEDVQRLLEASAAPDRLKKQKELLAKATALRHIAAKLRQRSTDDHGSVAALAKLESNLTDLAASLAVSQVAEIKEFVDEPLLPRRRLRSIPCSHRNHLEDERSEPDEVEEDYLKSAKRGSIITVNEDDDDDDEDDDDDDDDYDDDDDDDDDDDEESEDDENEDKDEEEDNISDEEDMQNASQTLTKTLDEIEVSGVDNAEAEKRFVKAIYDFHPEQDGDLVLKEGEMVQILSVRPDGWWEAQNDRGDRGMIPSTFVTEVDHSELAEPEMEETGHRPAEDQGVRSKGWAGVRSFVKSENSDPSSSPTKKTADVTSVLRALGAVPSGFRNSTLAELASNRRHSTAKFLFPALSESGLAFRDVHWDPASNGIRPVTSWVTRTLGLVQCKNVPTPGAGVEVISRCARLCLFDGSRYLSNVHTIAADLTKPQDPTVWTFRSRPSPSPTSVPPIVNDCPDVFLRTSQMMKGIGILIELGLSYRRVSDPKETGELSCGWVHLPFIESHGAPVPSRNYELNLKGGTPLEPGVDLDASVTGPSDGTASASTSKWKTLLSKSKIATIIFRMGSPASSVKDQISLLPETLIGSLDHLGLFVMYRQVLADHLLRQRLNPDPSELLHDPFLRFFLRAADSHDILEGARLAWTETQKKLTRAEKRDPDGLKRAFRWTFLGVAAPVLMSAETGEEAKTSRPSLSTVTALLNAKRSTTPTAVVSPAVALLSPDLSFKPFDVRDVALDLLRPDF